MKKMKHKNIIAIALAAVSLTACSDFFNPDTEDKLNGDDYISSNTEMYTGFLGIMTKMQAIGDKEILLTDTRADLLEPTDQSNADLIAIYNYDTDLQNNSYANPAGYYEVIIACNDYIEKMKEYRKQPQVADSISKNLMSSALRIKVWAYKTLGEIYGQAVWFNDPVTKVSSISDPEKFKRLDMPELVDSCLAALDNGVDGVSSNLDIDWVSWIDPENVTSVAKSSYRYWNYMVPPYEGLYAELCLWKGAVLDSKGTHDTYYYKKAADILLAKLDNVIYTYKDNSFPYWMPSAATDGHYVAYWNSAQPYANEVVAALIYDYTKNQTNTLLKHFSTEYPNEYLLRPSEYGMAHYTDASFNPGAGEGERRTKTLFASTTEGYYISKFRAIGSTVRANAYQDDVHIYLYRATQYHMLLAEALNNLNRWKAVHAVLNVGVNKYKSEIGIGDSEWEGFTKSWTNDVVTKYPNTGIRGSYTGLSERTIIQSVIDLGSEQATRKYNDEAILDETMIEFACEGKTYPAMNRMALRYNDLSIISSRVAPKYKAAGKDAAIKAKIEAGGNYVNYDLNLLQDTDDAEE